MKSNDTTSSSNNNSPKQPEQPPGSNEGVNTNPSSAANSQGKISTDEVMRSKKRNENVERVVRFDSAALSSSNGHTKTLPLTPPPPPFKDPRKFGKADIKRDSLIFLGIMGLLFYAAIEFDPTRKATKKPSRSISSVLENLSRKLNEIMHHKAQSLSLAIDAFQTRNQYMRTEDCSLFLHPTSIPMLSSTHHHDSNYVKNTNKFYRPYNSMNQYSLFAGKNYSIGENIIIPSSVSIVKLVDHAIVIPAYVLFMKHHPVLSNVRGKFITWLSQKTSGEDDMEDQPYHFILQASQSIQEGEELIVDYNNHIHSILLARIRFISSNDTAPMHDVVEDDKDDVTNTFQSEYKNEYQLINQVVQSFYKDQIPLISDYNIADQILDDMLSEIAKKVRHQQIQNERTRTNMPIKRSSNNDILILHTRYIFGLLQRSIAIFDPLIATFLPGTFEEFSMRYKNNNGWITKSTSIYQSLRNVTIQQLQMNGICLHDIQYSNSNNDDDGKDDIRLVNRQHVKSGQIITKIPFLIVRKDDGNNKSNDNNSDHINVTNCIRSDEDSDDNDNNRECSVESHETSSRNIVAGNVCYGLGNHSLPIAICPLNVINDNDSTMHIPSTSNGTQIPNIKYSFDFNPMLMDKSSNMNKYNQNEIRIIDKNAPYGAIQLIYINIIAIQDIQIGDKLFGKQSLENWSLNELGALSKEEM